MKKIWHIPIKDEKFSVVGLWRIGDEIYNKILQTGKENIENFEPRKIFIKRENGKIIIHYEQYKKL